MENDCQLGASHNAAFSPLPRSVGRWRIMAALRAVSELVAGFGFRTLLHPVKKTKMLLFVGWDFETLFRKSI